MTIGRNELCSWRGFLIVNYEQVLKDLPELVRLAPDVVVLDEAQRIKNWAAKTSMYVKALTPRWRLVLTGTPLENRLDELASLLEWVDDLAVEPKWRLAEWHTVRANGGRDVVGDLVTSLVLTQGRKVVVFSAWKRMLRLAAWAVSDLLADAGLRAVFFTGDESTKRRTQNVVDFHDDDRARLFFATDAGGVGPAGCR